MSRAPLTIADFRCEPPLPTSRDLRLGIVGAGTIVRTSHLPAYLAAAFPVTAIADPDRAKAEELAREFGVERVYTSAAELVADPDVHVVDIAVPPAHQPSIALTAIAAGKHALCHKPLALCFEEAEEVVEAAERAGVKLAVNQNARWSPPIRAIANLLADGVLGEPCGATFDIAWDAGWTDRIDSDSVKLREYVLRGDCVHHIDTCRLWFGEPTSVLASSWRGPGQSQRIHSKIQITLQYSPSLHGVILSDADMWAGTGWAWYRVIGTEGFAYGTMEQYAHYGHSIADKFELSLRSTPQGRIRPSLPTTTIPHAFIATMAQLLIAIETDGEAETSGRDNLRTLRVLEAASASIERQRVVRLDELSLGGT